MIISKGNCNCRLIRLSTLQPAGQIDTINKTTHQLKKKNSRLFHKNSNTQNEIQII